LGNGASPSSQEKLQSTRRLNEGYVIYNKGIG